MAVLQIAFSFIHELFVVGFVGFLLIYVWFKYKYTYWTRKGVTGPKPSFPFGNFNGVIRRKKQFFQPFCDAYFEYKKLPYVGLYSFNVPVLSINDPDLVKQILVKDFDSFLSHGMSPKPNDGDPLGGHLFNLYGSQWKALRAKLSPMFTTGKLKTFFPLINKVAGEALEYSDEIYEKGLSLNFSEFYAKYAMEIIGSIGFGIENDGFKKETEFFKFGHEYFQPSSVYWTLTRAISYFTPGILEKLQLNRTNPEINQFFYDLVRDTVNYRENNKYSRNDFIQALIDLQKSEKASENKGFKFTFTDVAANAMLYMFAGYDTSATTGMFMAYELARNPEIQTKVREEIKCVLAKYNGEITFEAQNDLTYMNMVIDETLRKYPPLRALFRRCNKDFKMPDSDLVIENGTLVFIPIQAIHMDPDIFEDPERFNPERFTPERKAKMHPCHWLPFGEGPRKCLGLRQGYIQSKVGLIKLLTNYELCLDKRTITPIEVKVASMSTAAEGDIWIKLRKLENC